MNVTFFIFNGYVQQICKLREEKPRRVKAQEFKVINPVGFVCKYLWMRGRHSQCSHQTKEITMRGPLGYTEFANLHAIEKLIKRANSE